MAVGVGGGRRSAAYLLRLFRAAKRELRRFDGPAERAGEIRQSVTKPAGTTAPPPVQRRKDGYSSGGFAGKVGRLHGGPEGFDNTNENSYHSFTMRLEEDKPGINQGPEPRTRTFARRVPSRDLLGASGELVIEHNGREYRLRLTQSGKLILTA